MKIGNFSQNTYYQNKREQKNLAAPNKHSLSFKSEVQTTEAFETLYGVVMTAYPKIFQGMKALVQGFKQDGRKGAVKLDWIPYQPRTCCRT